MTRKRLRVAFVTPGFVDDRDDPGLPAVVDLVERVAAVHDCEVVALRHPARRPPYRVAGATVHALGLSRARGPAGRAAILARGVAAVVARHRCEPLDVFHALWADEAGAVATLAARLLRRPAMVSIMGGELVGLPDIRYGAALGRGGRWTAAIALRLADRVTVGSEFGRELARGRVPAARLRVMPLGVDRAVFEPSRAEPAEPAEPNQPAHPGQPRILFVGSLEPVKDPAMLVRAFRDLAADRPHVGLAIAGDGRLRAELDDLIARLGLQDRVRFLGRLPRAGMPLVYRSASVLAVPSRHEGQSMVAVEAVACGLPVVGTRVGILPELGDAALTVPIGDERALTAALASVLDDPTLNSRMSSAAGEAAARFDLDHTTEAFLAAYDELVAARAS